jgi:hypothetical protein
VTLVDAVRRRAALFLIAGAALALAACATPEPPAPASAKATRTYTETISSVLVSEDGRRIAAIGSGHHYIFDAPDVLVKALRSPVHPQLTATFAAFHLDQRGVLTGDWMLTLAPDATPAQQQEAQAVGLARGDDGAWTASGRLKGQRFTGWTYKLRGPQDRLNKAYEIEISTEASGADVAVDEAATPIRVAADGVQLIYWAPLAPVIVPILFLTRAKDH